MAGRQLYVPRRRLSGLWIYEPEKSVKRIVHVNQHVIRKNVKEGTRNPPVTVKTYKENRYGMEVEIPGPSKVVYSPDKPLSCGARLWIETHEPVLVDGEAV